MGLWQAGKEMWVDIDDKQTTKAIRAAFEAGITTFDTAEAYGKGHSEQILASATSDIRHKVIYATKVFANHLKYDQVMESCHRSLKNLQTDYIDLYQFHDNGYPADKALPVRETLEELVQAGKIRAYGWSTDFPDRARVFAEGKNCTSIQLQLNVLDDNPEVISVCEKHDLAAINRGPLAMGLLTGKYTATTKTADNDVRGAKAPDWMKYFKDGKPNSEWLEKREAVKEILTSNGRTVTQGALAWLWARSPKTIPIPGFRTVKQVEENVRAMEFGPLNADQMKEIETLLR
jgi:aryl-alcohol dehydrogenase-like predicted oxidoreductase